MTQEQKDLLSKDLCARLPYGVKVEIKYYDDAWELLAIYTNGTAYAARDIGYPIETYSENCKPYLFPLSSMTEEQKYDFYCRFIENDCDFDDFKEFYLDNGMWHKLLTSLDDIEAIIDWFHKNHIDYRGLIPMGLANDATGLDIY
jgi:hypothetical protein